MTTAIIWTVSYFALVVFIIKVVGSSGKNDNPSFIEHDENSYS